MCEQIGKYDGKRVVWAGINAASLRTDASFRSRRQPDYHKESFEECKLLSLDIDMIKDFPPDFMHQGGGTMKKILNWFIKGPRKEHGRMSAANIALLDDRIRYANKFLPADFARKLRTTQDLPHYKFTELRQFLLYTGKLLLLNITASKEQYKNFLTLSVACCLMTDPCKARSFHSLASYLMKAVVSDFSLCYGAEFLTYNAHVMQHFPEVAAHHGGLDNVSAYPFENHLRKLKKLVRSSHIPIVSIIKGILRRQSNLLKSESRTKITVKCNSPNNVYINADQRIFEVIKKDNETDIKSKEYLQPQVFFSEPLPSSLIGCFLINTNEWRFYT